MLSELAHRLIRLRAQTRLLHVRDTWRKLVCQRRLDLFQLVKHFVATQRVSALFRPADIHLFDVVPFD